MPPLLRFFYHCLQTPSSRGFFWADGGTAWSPDQLASCVKRHTAATLGFSINMRQWRHIAIALDRRLLLEAGCRIYKVFTQWERRALQAVDEDGFGSEPDFDVENGTAEGYAAAAAIHHLQVVHTSRTNTTVYDNDVSLHAGLNDTLLAAFTDVSTQWHRLTGLLPTYETTACGAKRARRDSAAVAPPLTIRSHLSVRRKF